MQLKVNVPSKYIRNKLFEGENIIKTFHQTKRKFVFKSFFSPGTIALVSLFIAEIIYLIFAFALHLEIFNQDFFFLMPGPIVFISFAEIAICMLICGGYSGGNFRYGFSSGTNRDSWDHITESDVKAICISSTVFFLCFNAIISAHNSYYAYNEATIAGLTIICLVIVFIDFISTIYWFSSKSKHYWYLLITSQRAFLLDAMDGFYSYMYLDEDLSVVIGQDGALRITYNFISEMDSLDSNETSFIEFPDCKEVSEASELVSKINNINDIHD